MAIMTGIVAYIQFSNEQLRFEEALQEEQDKDEIIDDPQTDMQLGALLSVQPLALELGMDLVPLVDDRTSERKNSGTLIQAIQNTNPVGRGIWSFGSSDSCS